MPPDITHRYEQLGLHWERTPLWWDATEQKKRGLRQHLGKTPAHDRNAVIIHLKDLMVIDLDDDDEGTRFIKPFLDEHCGMIAKTRKGFHYVFPAFSQINKGVLTKVNGFAVDVITGDNNLILAEPTTYAIGDDVVRYEWLKFPATLDDLPPLPTPVYQWLLLDPRGLRQGESRPANAGAGRPPSDLQMLHQLTAHRPTTGIQHEPAFVAPTEAPPDLITEIDQLCGCLTPEWLNAYDNWLRLGLCLKTLSNSDYAKGIFIKHSRRSPRHDNDATSNSVARTWDTWVPKGRLSMGSLKHWAKKCNPSKYFDDAKKRYWSLIKQGTSNAYCELFYNAMAGDIIYSNIHKCFYLYKEDGRNLWVKCENPAVINYTFCDVATSICYKLLGDIPQSDGSDEGDDKRKGTLKLVTNALKTLGGSSVITLVTSFLPAFAGTETEDDPATHFNAFPGCLPLLNGVWVFKEKRLVPYERTHFYTYKIPIAYRADADMTDINKACRDWFRNDAEVIRFVRFFIGYCLTDSTSRQEFLIVYGNSASNGKSLLWGKIVPMLVGNGNGNPYFKKLEVKNLANKGETNDALYQCFGRRYGYLAEPDGAVNVNLFKSLTSGDEAINVRTLYTKEIEFIPIIKTCWTTNAYPEMKMDEGVSRRMRVLEQNVRFCKTQSAYDEAPQNLKDEGYVKLADDGFVNRLLANKEGLMLWALMGANDYIDNPSMEPPEVMKVAEKKAKDNADVLGNWVKLTLTNYKTCPADKRPEAWTTEKVRFSELKRIGKEEGLVIKYDELRKTLVALGFDVGGRPGKGDECVKFAGLVPDEEETNGE